MENYRKSSHCTYDIKYHLVWITKYGKPVITGQIALRTRELIRIVCQSNEVEILAGHVGSDYIHLLVSVPPHLSASKLVQYIKGNTSRKLHMEYKELNRQFWGQHLWAREYFVASSGNVTDEIIKEYIKNQDFDDYRTLGKKDDVSFAVTRLDEERGVAVGIITRVIRHNLWEKHRKGCRENGIFTDFRHPFFQVV